MMPMPSDPTFLPAVIDVMEDRERKEEVFSIWVNWEKRIISFAQEEGFSEMQFQTHEEKIKFAIERGNEGFGIQ